MRKTEAYEYARKKGESRDASEQFACYVAGWQAVKPWYSRTRFDQLYAYWTEFRFA